MRWLAAVFLCACDGASAIDGGTDGGREPDARAPADAGPALEAFASLGANAEGIALGDALYVSTLDDRIVRITADGTVSDFASIDDPLGIAVQSDGQLVVCAKTDAEVPVVFLIATDGTSSVLVPSAPGGEPFALTNFVAIAPDGSLVFSDSAGDRVYRADADGSNVALVTDAITYPNGMAFAADGSTLYVASWDAATVYALSFDAGTYGAPVASIETIPNIDGVVAASDGSLVLVTSTRGVVIATPGSDDSTTIVSMRDLVLPANAVLGEGAFGDGNLYIASLGENTVSRIRTSLAAP
jgi:sugar lactone lactonase YvrE